MTIKELIIEWLTKQETPIVDFAVDELYKAFPLLNKSSIRSAVSRMKQKGEAERVDTGVYEVEIKVVKKKKKQYQLYLHTKRVEDTHQKNPKKHSWDIDVEMNILGTAPKWLSEDDIDLVVNPILVEKALELLSDGGVFIVESTTYFDVTGSEWRDEKLLNRYDPVWKVEVNLVNKYAVHYTFSKTTRIEENQFG